MASPTADTYTAPAGAWVYAGRGLPAWAPGPGEMKNISLNTRQDINPRNDAALNPNYPSLAPWEASVGWGASALSAYCGAVFCAGIGSYGTLMTWGAAGHSTNVEATCWVAFDVAARSWKLIGKPLPCSVVATYTAGVAPAPSQLDHTWGDWIGGSTDWPMAFRQPGYNPPMGSHTRNSFVALPPSALGNTKGGILVAWQPTGNTTGTGLAGSWVWDADTELFTRTANVRPSAGGAVAGIAYHAASNAIVGQNQAASTISSVLDVMPMSTKTWARRNAAASVSLDIDSTNFTIGDLFVMVNNTGTPVFMAAPISTVLAGGSWAWTALNVSAASWPTNGSGSTNTVAWSRCPIDGCFYAVNRQAGSLTLWKLSPPAADSNTTGLLAGTWVVTSQTLTGPGLEAASFDYSRLQWAAAINAFLWFGDAHTSTVQAIRPVGV